MMTLIGGVDSHRAQLEIDAREEVRRRRKGGGMRDRRRRKGEGMRDRRRGEEEGRGNEGEEGKKKGEGMRMRDRRRGGRERE